MKNNLNCLYDVQKVPSPIVSLVFTPVNHSQIDIMHVARLCILPQVVVSDVLCYQMFLLPYEDLVEVFFFEARIWWRLVVAKFCNYY